jgi:hypothetical protein
MVDDKTRLVWHYTAGLRLHAILIDGLAQLAEIGPNALGCGKEPGSGGKGNGGRPRRMVWFLHSRGQGGMDCHRALRRQSLG